MTDLNEKRAREIVNNYDKEMTMSRKKEMDFIFQRDAAIATGFLQALEKMKPVIEAAKKISWMVVGTGRANTAEELADIEAFHNALAAYERDVVGKE